MNDVDDEKKTPATYPVVPALAAPRKLRQVDILCAIVAKEAHRSKGVHEPRRGTRLFKSVVLMSAGKGRASRSQAHTTTQKVRCALPSE